MKKRILILVSTLVCALTTVALVAVTIVGAIKSNKVNNGDSVPPIVDVGAGNGSLISEDVYVNLIVGDSYSDGVLTKSNYTGTLLEATSETTFVAKVVGSEQLSIQIESVVKNYNINVYEMGDGTEANPFIIVNPEDLITLVNENMGDYKYYSQKGDLDLSSYESWAPIGTLSNPFIGSYNGNGYSINNLQIVVTPENVGTYKTSMMTKGGSVNEMLTVGFFGYVGDVNAVATSYIKELSIKDAFIDTTAIETDSVRTSLKLTQSYVGTLAGYTAYTDIIGAEDKTVVTSTINSSISADSKTTFYTAVSGFVGGSYYSNISGYSIKADITGKNPGTIQVNEGKTSYYGSVYAGVLGYNFNTNVENIAVELSADVKNYEGTVVSGAFAYIESGKNARNISIKNIEVNNLYVKLNRVSNFTTYTGLVSGAVNANYNNLTVMENISVNNAVVNAIGTGQVSGIITTNYGTLRNAKVSGVMKATIVAGVVYENYGDIEFNSEMQAENAVNVELKGQTKVAGVAIYNNGKIIGDENLTKVVASLSWSIVNKDFDKNKANFIIAGIAVQNKGTIKNIQTQTNIYDAVNAGGAVGMLEGTIENCVINTTIRTIVGKVGTTQYSGKSNLIGGIVMKTVGGASKIIDVTGNITVNNTKVINTENLYGLNVFGSVVASMEGDVKVLTTTGMPTQIQVTLFTNYSENATQYIGKIVGVQNEGTKIEFTGAKVSIAIVKTANGAVII